jgi:hypothetical protein
MTGTQLEQTVRRLGGMIGRGRSATSDSELLRTFCSTGDQTAFGEILWRHGGLVRAVCGLRGNHPGVDDAWQATFVLARTNACRTSPGGCTVSRITALSERRAVVAIEHEATGRSMRRLRPSKQRTKNSSMWKCNDYPTTCASVCPLLFGKRGCNVAVKLR